MSVIIPNMDMPRGCGECFLSFYDYDEDDLYIDKCVLTNRRVWNDLTERDEECPLMEIEVVPLE